MFHQKPLFKPNKIQRNHSPLFTFYFALKDNRNSAREFMYIKQYIDGSKYNT